jgi:hypothetical protein
MGPRLIVILVLLSVACGEGREGACRRDALDFCRPKENREYAGYLEGMGTCVERKTHECLRSPATRPEGPDS